MQAITITDAGVADARTAPAQVTSRNRMCTSTNIRSVLHPGRILRPTIQTSIPPRHPSRLQRASVQPATCGLFFGPGSETAESAALPKARVRYWFLRLFNVAMRICGQHTGRQQTCHHSAIAAEYTSTMILYKPGAQFLYKGRTVSVDYVIIKRTGLWIRLADSDTVCRPEELTPLGQGASQAG